MSIPAGTAKTVTFIETRKWTPLTRRSANTQRVIINDFSPCQCRNNPAHQQYKPEQRAHGDNTFRVIVIRMCAKSENRTEQS